MRFKSIVLASLLVPSVVFAQTPLTIVPGQTVTCVTPVATPSPTPSPSPSPTASPSPSPTVSPSPSPSPTPVPITSANYPGTVDVVCNGTSDSSAITAAFATAGVTKVRTHMPCGLNSAVVLTTNTVGFDGDNSPWIAETGVSPAVTVTNGANNYPTPPWTNFVLIGQGTAAGQTGLLLNGPWHNFINPQVSMFAINVQNGTNGYNNTFVAPRFWGDSNAGSIGLNCPTVSGGGEGIIVNGGAIFNLGTAEYNAGCGITNIATHMDTLTNVVENVQEGSGGAYIDNEGVYIEETGTTEPSSGSLVIVKGYNGYGYVTFAKGQIQVDDFNITPYPQLVTVTNTGPAGQSPSASFDNVRFSTVTMPTQAAAPAAQLVKVCGSSSLNGGQGLNSQPNIGVCP